MEYFAEGSRAAELSEPHCLELADELIERLEAARPIRRVLLLPPDITRLHSGAGSLTSRLYQRWSDRAEVVEPLCRGEQLGAQAVRPATSGQGLLGGLGGERGDRRLHGGHRGGEDTRGGGEGVRRGRWKLPWPVGRRTSRYAAVKTRILSPTSE